MVAELKEHIPRRCQLKSQMTADEAQYRADQLFAEAQRLPVGNGRTAILKEACDYRMLAEMKRVMPPPARTE